MEHEGSQLLLIERNLSASLEGVTIDVEETTEGGRLVITKEASE